MKPAWTGSSSGERASRPPPSRPSRGSRRPVDGNGRSAYTLPLFFGGCSVQIAYIALVTLYVIVCCFLVLVVLVQQGKGADIAGAFGGGGTQTAFGARGATTLLHKLTTGAFIGFIVLSLGLTLLQARQKPSVVKGTPQKVTTTGAFPKPADPAPAGQPAGAAPAAAAPAQPAPAAPGQPAPPPAKAPASNPSK